MVLQECKNSDAGVLSLTLGMSRKGRAHIIGGLSKGFEYVDRKVLQGHTKGVI
jgi:hypothetical protein